MPRETLAPTLRRFLGEGALPTAPNGAWTRESRALHAGATAELRALLAVARAARADLESAVGSIEDAATMPETFNVTTVRLARALARLRRVSAGRKRGEGRRGT